MLTGLGCASASIHRRPGFSGGADRHVTVAIFRDTPGPSRWSRAYSDFLADAFFLAGDFFFAGAFFFGAAFFAGDFFAGAFFAGAFFAGDFFGFLAIAFFTGDFFLAGAFFFAGGILFCGAQRSGMGGA